MGLGASLTTFSPAEEIRSADVNGNFAALNSASAVSLASATLQQPPILATGNQETGYVGVQFKAVATSDTFGVGVNFKTNMTNTPTSITLSPITSTNASGPTAAHINQYGFFFGISAAAPGAGFYVATYTTVGNCLLAVDSGAGTFDHHCDAKGCGHVSSGVPLSDLYAVYTPFQALAHTCPACGVVESFNTEFTVAAEQDATPQGSGEYATTRGAQAALIRQLMPLVGLAVR